MAVRGIFPTLVSQQIYLKIATFIIKQEMHILNVIYVAKWTFMTKLYNVKAALIPFEYWRWWQKIPTKNETADVSVQGTPP